MQTGFAIVAFVNLVLNLILPEEIEDDIPELTANEVDETADKEEWARIRAGHVKGSDEEARASSDIAPVTGKAA